MTALFILKNPTCFVAGCWSIRPMIPEMLPDANRQEADILASQTWPSPCVPNGKQTTAIVCNLGIRVSNHPTHGGHAFGFPLKQPQSGVWFLRVPFLVERTTRTFFAGGSQMAARLRTAPRNRQRASEGATRARTRASGGAPPGSPPP